MRRHGRGALTSPHSAALVPYIMHLMSTLIRCDEISVAALTRHRSRPLATWTRFPLPSVSAPYKGIPAYLCGIWSRSRLQQHSALRPHLARGRLSPSKQILLCFPPTAQAAPTRLDSSLEPEHTSHSLLHSPLCSYIIDVAIRRATQPPHTLPVHRSIRGKRPIL